MTKTDSGPQLSLRDPDVRLMLRVKEGESEAFEELLVNYQERLIRLFFHFVGDQETAEKLAQETFLRIYRSRHGYKPNSKFSIWLFKIASGLARNSLRSKGRRQDSGSGSVGATKGRAEADSEAAKMPATPARQLSGLEMTQVVQAALASLNDQQRLAVLLHKFEEMSYADIGATMDVTEDAVKVLLSRARDGLRVKLENYTKQGETWRGSAPSPA